MVVAVAPPWVPAATGAPESASRADVRPVPDPYDVPRGVTPPGGVHKVVPEDLSLQYWTTQSPAAAVTVGLVCDVVHHDRVARVGHGPATRGPDERFEPRRGSRAGGRGEARQAGVPATEDRHRRGGSVDPQHLAHLPRAGPPDQRVGDRELEGLVVAVEGTEMYLHEHILHATSLFMFG